MTIAYVGLGANLGDPRATLLAAFEALAALPQTRLVERSSLYRSAPLEFLEQPAFVNAVAKLDTELDAEALWSALSDIERQHGRERPFRNAPRTLDLDLLLHGMATLRTARLTLPHPRMHQRAFVLAPMLEIDADLSVPGLGPARELLAACRNQSVEPLAAP